VQKAAGLCLSRTVSESMSASNSLFVTVLATFAGNSFPRRCSIRIESATISMTKAQCRRAVAAVRPMERKCSALPCTKPFQFLFPVFSRFRWSRAQCEYRILTPLCGTSSFTKGTDAAENSGERTRLACWRWRPRHRELSPSEALRRGAAMNTRGACGSPESCKITPPSMPHADSSPRARAAIARYRDCTPPTARQGRSLAHAVFCWSLKIDHQIPCTRPSRAITPVLMIFSATFVAVPAFRRVEPATISGPVRRLITRSQFSGEAAVPAADVFAGDTPAATGGLHVSKMFALRFPARGAVPRSRMPPGRSPKSQSPGPPA